MIETLVAGGPDAVSEAPVLTGGSPMVVSFHYPSRAPGFSYSVSVARRRLQAVLSRGDEGYIAEAPELESLGYGASPLDALADLQESVEQYLEVLSEGGELAPRVRNHADFLHLLEVPRESWFASVRPVDNAAELE
jgi:predicted RNase H-like HicB family nuclease